MPSRTDKLVIVGTGVSILLAAALRLGSCLNLARQAVTPPEEWMCSYTDSIQRLHVYPGR